MVLSFLFNFLFKLRVKYFNYIIKIHVVSLLPKVFIYVDTLCEHRRLNPELVASSINYVVLPHLFSRQH
jgi:hypothetical protein